MTTETATMQGKTYRVGDKWTSYHVMVGVRDAGPRTADYQPASDPEMAEWLSYCYQRGARSVEVELVREDGEIVRVSDLYVFVLFAGDRAPKATPPGALTLLAPHQNESLF